MWWLIVYMTATVSATAPSLSCPSVCSSTLRQSLGAILGANGAAILAPFHAIIKDEYEAKAVYRKAKWTCFGINQFDACLKRCPSSFEKSAQLSSLLHWNEFCALLKKPSKAVLSYFSCERDHLQRVSMYCGVMGGLSPSEGLEGICRKLDSYRKCYSQQPHNCTTDALEIKEKIDDSLMATLERLLKMNSNRLRIPRKCSNWRRHRLRSHHGGDEDEEEEDADDAEGSSRADETVVQGADLDRMSAVTTSATMTTRDDSRDYAQLHDASSEGAAGSGRLHYRDYLVTTDSPTPLNGAVSHHLALAHPSLPPSPRPRWIGDVPSTYAVTMAPYHPKPSLLMDSSSSSNFANLFSCHYDLLILLFYFVL